MSAPGPGEYLIFVDESGDHWLNVVDPQYPIFVLAFCLISKAHYASVLAPAITKLKLDYLGTDSVVLHEREISKARPPFDFLRDATVRPKFMGEISAIVRDTPFDLVAGVIRKDALNSQYSSPMSPYHLAMAFGLERMFLELQSRGASQHRTRVVCESRGKKEDEDLELAFRRICAGQNQCNARFEFELELIPKVKNVIGLQLADLIARPIGRHVLNPKQPNAAYEVIRPKFRVNPYSRSPLGWGLKVFP